MNSLPAMPHYMNQLAEYAYNNFLHKGLALEKTRMGEKELPETFDEEDASA